MDFDVAGKILSMPTKLIGDGPLHYVRINYDGKEYGARFDSAKQWFIDDIFGLDYRNVPGVNTQKLRTEITRNYAENVSI